MIYIKFPNYEVMPTRIASAKLDSFRLWLSANAGNGPDNEDDLTDKQWNWLRGDRYALGVYIRDPEVATLFKLTFGL